MNPLSKTAAVFVLAIFQLGCARQICKELLAPQWGGDGMLSPSQIVLFHGCYDGDTCTFSFPTLPPVFGDRISVRLAGVDTPEMHGRCPREVALAQKALAFTESILVHAKQIELLGMHRDKYFRVDATVRADGQDISESLLKAHLAEPYNGGTKTAKWC